nr:hypothetical protein [Tanacetum cinerariifolium]GEY95146.1 hypothetical protein [Tanacetum cinerariifolium]
VMVTASLVNRDAVSTVCENKIFVFDEKFPALDSIRILKRIELSIPRNFPFSGQVAVNEVFPSVSGIMFTHDPRSARVSKGSDSPNLQAKRYRLERGLGLRDWKVKMQILKFVIKGWFGFFRLLWIFHAILSVMGTTAYFTWSSDFVHLGFFWVEVTKLTTDRLVNGSSCDGIDMIIKNLDLEPKNIVTEFYGPSRWKELSKESGSKILPCEDGSCWKAFKPIASLIAGTTLFPSGSSMVFYSPRGLVCTIPPPRNPNNIAPHPIATLAPPESPPLNVTSIKRPTTTDHDHQDKRPPKGSSSFKPSENLSPPQRSAAAVGNTVATPKKLLPPLLNILCCQNPSCDHILHTFFAHPPS